MIRITVVLLSLLLAQANARAIEWRGLSIAGDDSIAAFDNSQQALTEVLQDLGLASMRRYTSSARRASKNSNLTLLTARRLEALASQSIAAENEGCLIHLTSHGAENAGFYLSMGGGTYIAPADLARIVDTLCGDRRTVVLVSACFSGQFITDAIMGPNRIVLTAARADRPSFGCSASDTYTYWDGCLIEQLPLSKTWSRLYSNVTVCIDEKEAAIDALPSEPQAYFGQNTEGWRILR